MSERVSVEVKGLLFDMDGVLISSIGGVVRCWRRWAKQYDVPGADEFNVPHGVRAADIIRKLKPDFTEDEVKTGLTVIEDMEIEDVGDLKVLPGVRELLGSLPKERWTIVTSATRRLLLGRLKAAGLPAPEELIAADDVTLGKPNPEPYRKGAKLLGFESAECLVFEDAPSGVGAGVAAGSRVLGVLGTHDAHELYKAGASWVVASLTGVKVTTTEAGLRVEFEVV